MVNSKAQKKLTFPLSILKGTQLARGRPQSEYLMNGH